MKIFSPNILFSWYSDDISFFSVRFSNWFRYVFNQWVKSDISILSTESDGSIHYYIPAGDETKITNADTDVLKKMK